MANGLKPNFTYLFKIFKIEQETSSNPQTTSFKFLTYNVWFDSFFRDERMKELFEILKNTSPDFIGLQEVLPEFFQCLVQQKWVQENYYVSDINGESIKPYGVVLLSKNFPHKVSLFDMPSQMSRKLLVGEFQINGKMVHNSLDI